MLIKTIIFRIKRSLSMVRVASFDGFRTVADALSEHSTIFHERKGGRWASARPAVLGDMPGARNLATEYPPTRCESSVAGHSFLSGVPP